MSARLPLHLADAGDRARRLGWRLALGALFMVGFGYALVPLYQVFCELTGFNGTTSAGPAKAVPAKYRLDTSRLVTVEFVAATAATLPWDFRPDVTRVQVHPGQVILATFHARNMGNLRITGQAIPSVTPHEAAPYFHKIECFCFNRQPLAPGESKAMPVQFVVDPDLPPDIVTLTLAYTFFTLPGIRASADVDVDIAAAPT